MNLKEKLHYLWLKIKIKNKYEPNPKGAAILNYIANKYFNDRYNTDYIIQSYEDMIVRYHDKTANFVRKLFSEEYLQDLVGKGQYDDFIHSSAAMFMYVSVIYTFKNKQCWYDIIEDDKVRELVMRFVQLI